MRAAILIAFSCALFGIVLAEPPRVITDRTRCTRYVKNDPNEKGPFNKGEDWTYYGDMKINRDPTKHTIQTDVFSVRVIQPTNFFAGHDRTYRYELQATADRNFGGQYTAKVELKDKKGLGQEFAFAFYDSKERILGMNIIWPNQWCYDDQGFNADAVSYIRFYARRHDR